MKTPNFCRNLARAHDLTDALRGFLATVGRTFAIFLEDSGGTLAIFRIASGVALSRFLELFSRDAKKIATLVAGLKVTSSLDCFHICCKGLVNLGNN